MNRGRYSIAAAEARGYQRAIDVLRDRTRFEQWWLEWARDREHLESGGVLPASLSGWELRVAAAYLESLALEEQP